MIEQTEQKEKIKEITNKEDLSLFGFDDDYYKEREEKAINEYY